MKTEYFTCDCYSPEHTLRFVMHPNEEGWPAELYTEVYLNQYRSFFKRAWVALKYLFNYKSSYGDFDCWLMQPEDAVRLKELLEGYIKESVNTEVK